MNGMLVHGIEYDDTAIRGRVHPSAFSVPCALAAGTPQARPGKDMLAAYIAGVECAVRLGMAARGGFSSAGYNTVGIIGAFGSTLIAGKLFGLDARQLTMAQGIVYSTAAGNREFTATASWTKAFEAGWPGAGAITAVCLAREGYVGPATAYEGRFGLFDVYLKARPVAADLAAITAMLGEEWEFSRILIKMLPSCFFNHPIINATIALVTEHDLRARTYAPSACSCPTPVSTPYASRATRRSHRRTSPPRNSAHIIQPRARRCGAALRSTSWMREH